MSKLIRLVLPQWQGGNRIQYAYGAKILEFLAPSSSCETIELPVSMQLEKNHERDGIAYKNTLLDQTKSAISILKEKNPDQIVVFGGECSISLAPFSYMLEKYPHNTAIIWFDRHADISIAGETTDYHAMVVTTLLGEGDPDFSSLVPQKIHDNKLLYVGVNDDEQFNRNVCHHHHLQNIPPEDFANDPSKIIDSLEKMHIDNVLIHFDVDVIDLATFRSQSSANPDVYFERLKYIHPGASFSSLIHALNAIDQKYTIRCISIAEYLPWDIMNLQNLLVQMPLLNK